MRPVDDQAVAAKFGVTRQAISQIRRGVDWA
jgi:hypothetical protein